MDAGIRHTDLLIQRHNHLALSCYRSRRGIKRWIAEPVAVDIIIDPGYLPHWTSATTSPAFPSFVKAEAKQQCAQKRQTPLLSSWEPLPSPKKFRDLGSVMQKSFKSSPLANSMIHVLSDD